MHIIMSKTHLNIKNIMYFIILFTNRNYYYNIKKHNMIVWNEN